MAVASRLKDSLYVPYVVNRANVSPSPMAVAGLHRGRKRWGIDKELFSKKGCTKE